MVKKWGVRSTTRAPGLYIVTYLRTSFLKLRTEVACQAWNGRASQGCQEAFQDFYLLLLTGRMLARLSLRHTISSEVDF